LHSQDWNNDHLAVSSIPAPEHWWTEFVNTDNVEDEVYQNRQIVPESVSQTSHVLEAPSISAVFQPAFQPSGSSQETVDFYMPANFAIDFDFQASQACPDSADCITLQNSIPLVQSEENSTESSSTPGFDCDTYSTASGAFTHPENQAVRNESQEKPKSQLLTLPASKCPHCPEIFSNERLGYHIKRSHKYLEHPNICGGCNHSFSLPKDLKRHQTTTSCLIGSARPFACICGLTFTRKDHCSRHTQRKLGDDRHLAI
jgi:hypothetical protein